MVARVLIIGGYGHFGSYIARSLAGDAEIRLLVGGRSVAKAQAFIASIRPIHSAEAHAIDVNGELSEALSRIAPDVVIHTGGPFQSQDYRVRLRLRRPGPPLSRSRRRARFRSNDRPPRRCGQGP